MHSEGVEAVQDMRMTGRMDMMKGAGVRVILHTLAYALEWSK